MIMPKRPCICPVQMSFHFASYMQLRLRAASRWDSAVPRAIGNEMVSPTLALRACDKTPDYEPQMRSLENSNLPNFINYELLQHNCL